MKLAQYPIYNPTGIIISGIFYDNNVLLSIRKSQTNVQITMIPYINTSLVLAVVLDVIMIYFVGIF